MADTSMTIRERVAEVICRSACTDLDGVGGCECAEDGIKPQCVNVLAAADAAIAIVVEVFRNGQASLIEEEAKKDESAS